MKVTIPGQSEPISIGNGAVNPIWYQVFKFIETLSPLSDIVFPSDDTKSNVLRDVSTLTGTTYTLQSSDSGRYLRFSNSSAVTVTIPTNAAVPIPVNSQIDGIAAGTGKVTFSPSSGVNVTSLSGYKSLSGKGAGFTLVKTGVNDWDLVGTLIP